MASRIRLAVLALLLAAHSALAADVTILRDTWGTPHVFAADDASAMFGLGYAAAEDRAFQMYYTQRFMQGRLAELIGDRKKETRRETAVDSDRWNRTCNWYAAAQAATHRLSPRTLALLQAYSDGVNHYLTTRQADLHPLFAELGLEPEPWTPADCMVSWWAVAQFFGTDGTRELIAWRNQQQEREGADRGRAAARIVDDSAAAVQRHHVSDAWLADVAEFLREHGHNAPPPAELNPEPSPKFSHAWAVGGKLTTTGSAVLVSDPQTPVRNPSLFYEFHIDGETINARGIGVAGSPLILIGFNERVAWGATALGADQADLFRLVTDAEHPGQYRVDDQWLPIDARTETIHVRGEADQTPRKLDIRTTRFGPIVNDFAFTNEGDPLVALNRIPLTDQGPDTVEAAFAMMRAGDIAAFHRALAGWRFPSANFVFADREGRVGYSVAGAIPLRSPHADATGNSAADGSSHRFDWQAFVPHDLLPHVLDPREGYVLSANHRPIGSFYLAALGLSTGSAGDTVRSWRLRERLTAKNRFAPADVLDIHHDAVNPARRDLVRLGLHLRDKLKQPFSGEAMLAMEQLEPWLREGAKSDLTTPGAGAALAMQMNLYFRVNATDLALQFGGGETGLTLFLKTMTRRIADQPDAALDAETLRFIDATLAAAWRSAAEQFGNDPAQWNRRMLEQVAAANMGYYESLHGFGSLAAPHDLPMPALTMPDAGTIVSQRAQCYTQFVPLHDVDGAMTILPPGVSEHPDAPSRRATYNLWQRGQLHPAPLSRNAVEKLKTSEQHLSPP